MGWVLSGRMFQGEGMLRNAACGPCMVVVAQTEPEKSSVPLDAVLLTGNVLCDEALKFGNFEQGKFVKGMQDFLNKSRMGKDHYDRDTLSHDFYYAMLYVSEVSFGNWTVIAWSQLRFYSDANLLQTCGTDWSAMEQIYRQAVQRLIEFTKNPLHEESAEELR